MYFLDGTTAVKISVKKLLDKSLDILYTAFTMLDTITISTRDILRNYKEVFNRVRNTKQPAVVISKKKPQVAIVSLDDLEKLRQFKNKQSTKALLDMAGIIPKGSGLPADLSEKHNEYTWN